jgi:hypothetical protein
VIGFGSQKLGSTSALESCIVKGSGCAGSLEAGLNDLLGSGPKSGCRYRGAMGKKLRRRKMTGKAAQEESRRRLKM